MAGTEVIWFRFCTQAVHRVHSPTLKSSSLFEHSPPAV
jgi:hypothetical protein